MCVRWFASFFIHLINVSRNIFRVDSSNTPAVSLTRPASQQHDPPNVSRLSRTERSGFDPGTKCYSSLGCLLLDKTAELEPEQNK